MNEILLYFTIKYKGNWENIYIALSEKEQVRIQDVKKIPQKIKNNYISIIDKDYPHNLKTIYKPPFSIFWYGNINLLNQDLISITGSSFNKFDEQLKYLKKLKRTIFVVQYENDFLIEKMIASNFKIIAISNNGIDCQSDKYKNLIENDNLIISEIPEKSINKYVEQYSDRIFVGVSKAIIFLTSSLPNNSNILRKICKLENVDIYTFFKNKNTRFLMKETILKLERKLS
ncbi:MAG: hypothetical protein RRZ34_01380 [Malacoplasma sp.]